MSRRRYRLMRDEEATLDRAVETRHAKRRCGSIDGHTVGIDFPVDEPSRIDKRIAMRCESDEAIRYTVVVY